MENLSKLQQTVFDELEENPAARKSNVELILGVMKRMGLDTEAPFSKTLRARAINLESITRLRRKLQNEYPELRDEEIAEYRANLEKEYRNFMRAEG